jgi:alternate signal-mediated exported protein
MNKLTKGAIASAAGIILLMGGAGTLASWNASSTAGASQAISAGQLAVNTPGTGVWTQGTSTTAIDPATFKIVPGDTLTYSQTFNLAASGNNLLFTVAATSGALTATSASAADSKLLAQTTAAASFVVTGGNIAASTSANTYKVTSNSGSNTVTIKMTVSFPYAAADNLSMLGSVTLGTGAITLTQTQTA